MPTIFDFDNYRSFLVNWIQAKGSAAYGLKGRLAKALNISSTLVSLILKGEKKLSPDHASDLVDFLGLSDPESEYLHVLVDIDRAASSRYREKLERKRLALITQSRRVTKRMPKHIELSDEQKSIYYSSWLFSAIRILTSLPEGGRADHIAKRLGLDEAVVAHTLRFLISNGLCREVNGRLTFGPQSTHIDRESPFANQHHQNWRLQGLQAMERKREVDLFFTSPMGLSRRAAQDVRAILLNAIQNSLKASGPSESECVACLNIDWFLY